jgi:hypothetical protein
VKGGSAEGVYHLPSDAKGWFGRHGAVDGNPGRERLAINRVHRAEKDIVGEAKVTHTGDVRMLQELSVRCFCLEQREVLRLDDFRRYYLKRDELAVFQVTRAISSRGGVS